METQIQEKSEKPEEDQVDMPNFKELISSLQNEILEDFKQCYSQDDRELPHDDFNFLLLNSFYKVPKLAELFQGARAKFVDIIMATIPKDQNDCINFDDVMRD